MNLRLIFVSVLSVFFVSFSFCFYGEQNSNLQNQDVLLKYKEAREYFDRKKYNLTIAMLTKIFSLMRTTSYAAESSYILAQSYFKEKDYALASRYFEDCMNLLPKSSPQAEPACFYSVYSLYMTVPDARFDQSVTNESICRFQNFLECYPRSDKREQVQQALFELREKLAMKELLSVQLYYNLGNYLSCVITAQNALQSFSSSSSYREDFKYYIFKSKCKMAKQKAGEDKRFRYENIMDEYSAYMQDYYSVGKYCKKIQKLYTCTMKNNESNEYGL